MNRMDDHDGDVEPLSSRIKSGLAVAVSLAVVIAGLWIVGGKAKTLWDDFASVEDYGANERGKAVVVTIPSGATVGQMADVLVKNDVIKSSKTFLTLANKEERSEAIPHGDYQMWLKMTSQAALDRLLDPKSRIVHKVTVREGLRLTELKTLLARPEKDKGAGFDPKAIEKALANPTAIGLSTLAENNPEGFLFPATYEFKQGNPQDLLTQMATTFTQRTAPLSLDAKAAEINKTYGLNLTSRDLIVVASIVEAEARQLDTDGPKVAGLIYNRLRIGMKLQMDSTVHYANNITGRAQTTDAERALDHTHNTYARDGLPPSPINAPGEKAIKAATDPTAGDYLYFVTVNLETGETKFANTDAEHAQNVAEWNAWCQTSPERRKQCYGG